VRQLRLAAVGHDHQVGAQLLPGGQHHALHAATSAIFAAIFAALALAPQQTRHLGAVVHRQPGAAALHYQVLQELAEGAAGELVDLRGVERGREGGGDARAWRACEGRGRATSAARWRRRGCMEAGAEPRLASIPMWPRTNLAP
jgi:hypothetical protein